MSRTISRISSEPQNGKLSSPRLALSTSYWALLQLPNEMSCYIEQLCSMGFEYFEVGLRPERVEPATRILRESGLKLIGQGWAKSFEEAKPYFDLAHNLGAVAINMQLGHAYMSANEAAELVTMCREYASKASLQCITETHRGCCTQDLLRTNEWLKLAPGTPLCLDVSHYVVAGEGYGGSEKLFMEYLQPIMANTVLIHGRISDGEIVQCAINDEYENSLAGQIVQIWADAMGMWSDGAQSGDVLVFEPELGPPPYAVVDSSGREISDRWEQTARIIHLGQSAWEMALHMRSAPAVPIQA